MLLTCVVTYFRHKLGNHSNDAVVNLNKERLKNDFMNLISKHEGITENETHSILRKLEHLLDYWESKIKAASDANYNLKFNSNKDEESFLKTREQINATDDLITMQSVRNVEPSTRIKINQY